jgi:pimeloyl-ACP methyl ester carboxylesterase
MKLAADDSGDVIGRVARSGRGHRPTLVLIPGLQGRHEWIAPAAKALRGSFNVVSVSLYHGEQAKASGDPFGLWVSAIDAHLARAGGSSCVVVGHSFGGLVAARYAAARPERVEALVLVSAPSPRMTLDWQSALLVRHPWLTLPLFAARGAVRLAPEMIAARPTWRQRASVSLSHLARVALAPMAPGQMACWVRAWQARDIAADCASITAPTLVVTGEPGLDRVVPVASSLDYLTSIVGARHVTLAGAGHLGLVLRPDAFASVVAAFVSEVRGSPVAGDNTEMRGSEKEAVRARHD